MNAVYLLILVAFLLPPCLGQGRQYLLDGKPVSQDTAQAMQLMNEGVAFIHQGKADEAVKVLEKAVSLDPEMSKIHENLGVALSRIGEVDSAIKETQKAIDLDGRPECYYNLAGYYKQAGQLSEAMAAYGSFIERSENKVLVKSAKGSMRALKGEMSRRRKQNENLKPQDDSDYLAYVVRKGKPHFWSQMKMPLKVFISPGINKEFFNPDYVDILKGAFTDWQKRSRQLVRFEFTEKSRGSDIVVKWTDNLRKLAKLHRAGNTTTTANEFGRINSASIVLSTISPFKETAEPMAEPDFKAVCLHEIGHALGLDGHSTNPGDIMFYSVSRVNKNRELSRRDITTLNRLYHGYGR
jgi:predicted Zn-dependent protease